MSVIVVTGGRDFDDAAFVQRVLDVVHVRQPISLLLHGGARGADTLAGQWARSKRVDVEVHPARWDDFGRSAGVRRNREMLLRAWDLEVRGLVAFAGGRGTADCVRQARQIGIPVWEVGRA